MCLVPEKFRASIKGRAEVFVAFKDSRLHLRVQLNHAVKTIKLSADHEIHRFFVPFKSMQEHGSDGCFSV